MESIKDIMKDRSCIVVGIGNSERGDDGIGCYLLSKLKTRSKLDCGPVPENFTDRIRAANAEVILLVDAVDFGGRAGQCLLTEAENAKGVVLSTHALPLSLFCKLFPGSKIYLLGIQPGNLSAISREARHAADGLAAELNRILK